MNGTLKMIFKVDSLEELKKLEKSALANNLLNVLFSEESDYFYDNISDARDRAKGISPMSKEYQENVAKKRNQLLDKDTIAPNVFCLMEVEALLEGRATSKTHAMIEWLDLISAKKLLIEQQIKEQSLHAQGINPNDANTWSETMFRNLYKLEEAAALWELEDVEFSFEEFKHRLITDPEFRKFKIPKKGMEKEDYNPWGSR
jgi:hypothetical protein